MDFMNVTRDFNGSSGTWTLLLSSKANTASPPLDPFAITMLVEKEEIAKINVMRAFRITINTADGLADIYMVVQQDKLTKMWVLVGTLNNKMLVDGDQSFGDVVVNYGAALHGRPATIKVTTSFMEFTALQPWKVNKETHGSWVNFGIIIKERIPASGVDGYLARSLIQAQSGGQQRKKGATAAAAVIGARGVAT